MIEGYRMGCPDLASHQLHQLMLQTWAKDPEGRPPFKDVKETLEDLQSDYTDLADEQQQ